MTTREFAAVVGAFGPDGRGSLQRGDLDELMRTFPDRAKKQEQS